MCICPLKFRLVPIKFRTKWVDISPGFVLTFPILKAYVPNEESYSIKSDASIVVDDFKLLEEMCKKNPIYNLHLVCIILRIPLHWHAYHYVSRSGFFHCANGVKVIRIP